MSSGDIQIRIIGLNAFRKAVKKKKSAVSKLIKSVVSNLQTESVSKSIARALSLRCSFSPEEILNFYHVYGSWDETIIVIGYCEARGFDALDAACIALHDEFPYCNYSQRENLEVWSRKI
jgi:hypothetical protein